MRPAAGASPDAGGGSPDEVGERNTEGVSDTDQVVDQRTLMALLDPIDGLPVHAC